MRPTETQMAAAQKMLDAGWTWQEGFGPRVDEQDDSLGLYLQLAGNDDSAVMIDPTGRAFVLGARLGESVERVIALSLVHFEDFNSDDEDCGGPASENLTGNPSLVTCPACKRRLSETCAHCGEDTGNNGGCGPCFNCGLELCRHGKMCGEVRA